MVRKRTLVPGQENGAGNWLATNIITTSAGKLNSGRAYSILRNNDVHPADPR